MSFPKFVQARKTTLYTPVSSTETSEIVLSKLVDIYGNELSMSDFGTTMYVTINPGGDSEEIISVTGFTRNSDDTVTLDTGITRALKAVSDYTSGGTASAHAAGTTVVVSNNPQLYKAILDVMVNNFGEQTIAGVKTFSSLPKTTAGDPVEDNDLARKNYVDGVVAGAFTTARVVVGATAGETIADGEVVYFDTTDDEWKLANAATAATCQGVLLGIAQGAGTDGNAITNGVLIIGVDDAQSGLTGGDVMYLSDTPGAISSTPGTVEVTVGLAKMESTTELYFTPNFQHFLTEDQQDALENPTSGTALSASNGVVDEADVAENTASKIVRRDTDGKVSGFIAPTKTMTAGETINGGTTPVAVFLDTSDDEVYACDADDIDKVNFIGFAISNGTDGNDIEVQISGIVNGFTGLTKGEVYYVQDDKTIGTSYGTYPLAIGRAVSTTEILIEKNQTRFKAVYTTGSNEFDQSETYDVAFTVGFRPKVIELAGLVDTGTLLISYHPMVAARMNPVGTVGTFVMGTWNEGVYSSVESDTYDDNYGTSELTDRIFYSDNNVLDTELKGTIISITDTGFTLRMTKGDIDTRTYYWRLGLKVWG